MIKTIIKKRFFTDYCGMVRGQMKLKDSGSR